MAETTDIAARTRYGPVERSAEEIRQDIETKRENISETVDLLGERIQQTLDWRVYVGEHPYVALGAAAGLAFLVSGFWKRRPSPQERILDALAETVEDTTDRIQGYLGNIIGNQRSVGTLVKGAATAAAAKAATDFLKNKAIETFVGSRKSQWRDRGEPVAGGTSFDPDLRTTH